MESHRAMGAWGLALLLLAILLIQAGPGRAQSDSLCSRASIKNCTDVLLNYTRSMNLTMLRPFPLDNQPEMDYLCSDIYGAYKDCYSDRKQACASSVMVWAHITWDMIHYLCSNESRQFEVKHGSCLMSQKMGDRLESCNSTWNRSRAVQQSQGLSPSQLSEARCKSARDYLYCVRYQTWVECDQEASDWVYTIDKHIMNDTMRWSTCSLLEESEPVGVGWSLMIQTTGWWVTKVPQILRIQGDPAKWVPESIKSGNITRKTISGDYNKFRFGILAADYWNNRIVWFNEARNSINFIPYWFTGSASTTTIFSAVSGKINGIATDWVGQNVYWTDSGHGWIAMASYKEDSIGRHLIVIDEDMDEPTGIATDPYRGLLFWTDKKRQTVERSTLDGKDRTVWHTYTGASHSPSALAVDPVSERLFVLDNQGGTIESISVHDKTIKTRLVEYNTDDYKIIQIDVYKDFIFAIQETGKMLVFSQNNGSKLGDVSTDRGDPEASFGVSVFAPDKQKPIDSPCVTNNGGCDQLCIPRFVHESSPLSKVCACTLGFALQKDNRTCASKVPDDNFLLIADNVGRDIYMLDLATEKISSVPLNASNIPFALAFEPFNKTVFWLDGGKNDLCRTSLDGTWHEVIYNFGAGRIFEISYDWMTNRVIFSDTHFQRIGAISLWGTSRVPRMLLYSPEPTDIALDVRNRTIYWSDWRDGRAMISRSHLDYGNGTKRLITTGLVLPGGLTVDTTAGLLFWCDAFHSSVEQADIDGGNRRTLVSQSRGAAFFSIAADPNFLYITDLNNRTLRRLNRTSNKLEVYGPPEFQKAIALRLYSSVLEGSLDTTVPVPSTFWTTTSLPRTSPYTHSTTTRRPKTTTTPGITRSSTPTHSTSANTNASTPTAKTKPSTTTTGTTTTKTSTTSTTPTTTTTTATPSTTTSTVKVTTPTKETPSSVTTTPSTPLRKTKPSRTTPTTAATTGGEGVVAPVGQSPGGLSGGAVAGIVIAMLVLAAAVVIVAFFVLKHRGINVMDRVRGMNPFQRFESEPHLEDESSVTVNDELSLERNESRA